MPAMILSGLVHAALLLVAWFLGLIVTLVVAWLALRAVRLASNRRKVSVAIMPLIGIGFRVVARMPSLVLLTVLYVVLTRVVGPIDPSAPEAVRYGEYIFSFAFVLLLAIAVPRAYGLSLFDLQQNIDPSRALAIGQVRLHGGVLVGLVVGMARGPHGLFSALAGLAYVGGMTWLLLDAVAEFRRDSSPKVVQSNDVTSGEPVVVQVSDMHITDRDGRVPMGGGASGLPQLEALAAKLIATPESLSIVVVSGDLVDRGTVKEWERGMGPLLALQQAACVVLAPGNHDLLPSYTASGLLWASVRPGVSRPVVDGTLVQRYFNRVVQLEPRLTTWQGVSLVTYLADFAAPWQGLERLWNSARDEAAAAMGLPPGTSHSTALKKYRANAPEPALRLEARFIEGAMGFYPTTNAAYWKENIYLFDPHVLAEFFQGDPWHDRWYDPYPLKLTQEEQKLEILIVNSNPRAPLLAQSSLGQCGDEQLARLDTLLASSRARTSIVVHHHAIAAWTGEPASFARWGILAHDPVEGHRLFEMLARAGGNRNILLLTGHVHEASRYGWAHGADGGGFWYLESAALGEPGGASRLGLVRAADGTLRPAVFQ